MLMTRAEGMDSIGPPPSPLLGCLANTQRYAVGETLTVQTKQRSMEAVIAQYVAQGWILTSSQKVKNGVTLHFICAGVVG